MTNKIRVVIADAHKLFREGLHFILNQEREFEIVGEATTCLQAIMMISDLKPDVVLFDIKMLDNDDGDILLPIKDESPKTKLLILTSSSDDAKIFSALKEGAKGYLSKDADTSDLVKAIHAVHQGELWVERKVLARFFEKEVNAKMKGEGLRGRAKGELTSREKEVLRCLSAGNTNKEIAQRLFISEKTVKSHLNSIFKKLNVTGRFQAIVIAIQKGLH